MFIVGFHVYLPCSLFFGPSQQGNTIGPVGTSKQEFKHRFYQVRLEQTTTGDLYMSPRMQYLTIGTNMNKAFTIEFW